MKIIKSKYTSEGLRQLYQEADEKIDKKAARNAERLSNFLNVFLPGVMFIFCHYIIVSLQSIPVELKALILCFILLFTVSLGGLMINTSPFERICTSLYERKGYILKNPLDKHGIWFLIKLLDSCEEISEVMENLEGSLYSFENNIFTVFEQIDDSQISLKIEIRVPNILMFEVYDENEDTLDFSRLDDKIAEAIEHDYKTNS